MGRLNTFKLGTILFLTIFLQTRPAKASEVWIYAPVMEPKTSVSSLQGIFLTEAEQPAKIAECTSRLKKENPAYQTSCQKKFGNYKVDGRVQTSLLGSHISCEITCVEPAIPIGNCVVQRYIDRNRIQKNPFLLLQTSGTNSYTLFRIILEPGMSDLGAVVELIRHSQENAKAASRCGYPLPQ